MKFQGELKQIKSQTQFQSHFFFQNRLIQMMMTINNIKGSDHSSFEKKTNRGVTLT